MFKFPAEINNGIFEFWRNACTFEATASQNAWEKTLITIEIIDLFY